MSRTQKTLGAALLLLTSVFVVSTWVPASPEMRAQAAAYFTDSEIEHGLRFAFERRLLYWAGLGLHLAILTWIVFSGFGRKLADACLALTHGRWLPAVLLVGGFCFLLDEAVGLPLGLMRLENLRAWNLTHRPVAGWLVDHFVALGVEAVIGGVALAGLYLLLRFFPRAWWVLASAGTMVLAFVVALVLPIWIAPLFNTFTHLAQTPWSDLQGPVQALARRAGVPVTDILVADASRQGSHTNAYFSGFGSTRRIVLYDTLLRAHTRLTPTTAAGMVAVLNCGNHTAAWQSTSLFLTRQALGRDELESILAHEMGHWQHNHIVKGIALGTLAALIGFYVLGRILRRSLGQPRPWLRHLHDPAGIPLVLLMASFGLWLASPLENAVSRHFERQADMVSLEVTRRPEIFIEAEKRLARDNISNVVPSRCSIWLFNTHPPAVERIRMAEEWKRMHGGGHRRRRR